MIKSMRRGFAMCTPLTLALLAACSSSSDDLTTDAVSQGLSVTVGSGPDTLVLGMSEDAYQGNAQFTVKVDGKQQGGVQTTTASHRRGRVQSFTFLGSYGANDHQIAVTFLNDAYDGTPTTDRNLYVNSVTYDGTALANGSATLLSEGTVTFTTGGSRSSSGSGGGSGSDAGVSTGGGTTGATGTLAQLTSNNTSASSAFTDNYFNYATNAVGTAGMPTTNDDALPINVSNVSMHTLMPNHPGMKIYVETQSWFCHDTSNEKNGQLVPNAQCSGALDIGYDSASNAANQVDDMVRRGIDGAVVNWYGPGTIGDRATANMLKQSASAHGGTFEVTVAIDKGAFDNPPGVCANKSPTDTANCYLDYIDSSYAGQGAFMRINGKKAVYWFITQQDIDAQIDWSAVKNHANSLGMAMILDNPWDGFTFYNGDGFSDGAYAWVSADGTSGLDYLNKTFFPTAQQHPGSIVIGGTWRGFNDVAAGWSSNLHMPSRCGLTWLDTFAANDAKGAMSAVMIDTWDDYAEGSEMETGIENCLDSINVSVNQGTLSWQDSFGKDPWSGVSGSEKTIDHYEVWVAGNNGQSATLAAQVSPNGSGAGSVAISSLNVPSGNYVAYVRAVGKPSIQNHLSSGTSITR